MGSNGEDEEFYSIEFRSEIKLWQHAWEGRKKDKVYNYISDYEVEEYIVTLKIEEEAENL